MDKLIAALFARLFRKVRLSWCSAIEASAVPGSGGIVFLGDSITHNGRWDLLFPDAGTRNLGINGDRTDQVLERLEPAIVIQPRKLFLLIGTNDLGQGVAPDTIVANVERILDRLAAELPGCKVHLQTLMPRAAKFAARVQALNARYAEIAQRRGIVLIDLYAPFVDGNGKMRSELTYDDLHLVGPGYALWRELLMPYVIAG